MADCALSPPLATLLALRRLKRGSTGVSDFCIFDAMALLVILRPCSRGGRRLTRWGSGNVDIRPRDGFVDFL